ncbi:MAG: 4,5-DOPA dioxygenase extradiol [Acidimicrobiales bacterium]
MDATLTPAAFIGHGSPMNAIQANRYTEAWAGYAGELPERPKAILVISAHWYWNSTAVTAMSEPRTIHDFFGFPQELNDFRYAAPGDPELAAEIVELVKPTWMGTDQDAWGLDHGTWVVLCRMFPEADVPVVQLAINADKPLDYHFQLGAQLAPLRAKGVMVLGSGNVVHNLRVVDFSAGETGTEWAHRFDDDVREAMTSDPASLGKLAHHADFAMAAPTPDHYIPLLYIAGLASAGGQRAEAMTEGYFGGSLSMSSYRLVGQQGEE